jgi:hypothetical protein
VELVEICHDSSLLRISQGQRYDNLAKQTNNTIKIYQYDGSVIWHRQAIDTLIESLRKIGFEKVAKLDIQHGGGYQLVSKDKRPPVAGHIWQHECDGWYV